MAIAHDTQTVAASYTLIGTQTTSHAASASARAAVVLIHQNTLVNDEVSGVTYGGVAMTRLTSTTESTEAGRVYIYFLDGITGGTQNVAMTTTGVTDKQLVVATMTCAAGKVIKPEGTGVGSSASVANPSWTISPLIAGTELQAYEVIHSGLTTMTNTPASGWTLISSTDLGAQGRGFARQAVASSGTSLTSGWTAATADDFVGASVAFREGIATPPSVAAVGTYVSSSVDAALAVPCPSGVVNTSLVVIVGTIFSTTVGLNTPSGFTLLVAFDADPGRPKTYVWYKRATGSESADYSMSTDTSSAVFRAAVAFRIADDDLTNPFGTNQIVNKSTAGTTSAVVNISGDQVDELLLFGVALPTENITPPAGYTRRTVDTAQRIHLADRLLPDDVSTGNTSCTITASVVDNTAFLIAVNPRPPASSEPDVIIGGAKKVVTAKSVLIGGAKKSVTSTSVIIGGVKKSIT